MIKIAYQIPFLILIQLLRFVFIAAGVFLVPIATFAKAYHKRKSKYLDREILAWTWGFMWPWGNEEDGIVAGLEYPDKPLWFRIIYWSARRNPANNLRYIKPFSVKIDPKKVKFTLKLKESDQTITQETAQDKQYLLYAEEGVTERAFWYYAYQGIYSNFRIEFKMPFTLKVPFTKLGYPKGSYVRFWLGYKIYPSDMFGVETYDYRYHGAGVASQIKKLRYID